MSTRQPHTEKNIPLLIAIAVAILGSLTLLLANHGPGSKPAIRASEVNAASEAGATVIPTQPPLKVEPAPAGPKPVPPPIPAR